MMGGVGYPLLAVAQGATELNRDVRVGMLVAQMILSGAGMAGIG